ncbi:PREDICTED: uncharacterized protein LOC105973928 [Erythranthe guttata]|uniref:uncharacterized protein LOC105973928 n=1 Tax=Erythranthe guttata TaxID=4155 RepID=UPI00064DA105|nr:PREDICTED: uncharacterized protein LOC105973928 [Erythranthe guttata]XP_012854424.1 PREDICTED: uncharacterized protein LOC105973928 [Erythranthe guttata]|eukprot:XP_012854423.1 PREDICTED: uncharacterized protein LOC105973928 [Erythranthe guttata]
MADIITLLKEGSTSTQALDSYSSILQMRQEEGYFNDNINHGLDGDSYVFSSSLMYRFLLFPLHSKGNTRKDNDHLTLVVVDIKLKTWKHYNSYKPRAVENQKRTDPYLYIAETMVKAVEAVTRECKIKKIPLDATLEEVEDSPQQEYDIEDCGIFVLYIIRQYFRQQPVDKLDAEKKC